MTEKKNIQSESNIKIAFIDSGSGNTSEIISSIFNKKIKNNKNNEIGMQIRLLHFNGILFEIWDTKIDLDKTFDLTTLCLGVDGIVFIYQHDLPNSLNLIKTYLTSTNKLDIACTVLCTEKTAEIKQLATEYDLFLQKWTKGESSKRHFTQFLNARFSFVCVQKKRTMCCRIT